MLNAKESHVSLVKRFVDIDILIEIPENNVSHSTRIDVICIHSLVCHAITKRQLWRTVMENVAILNYMKRINQLTVDIGINTKRLLVTGYQKQLTYKHNDGLFSVLGESDESGSSFLTAFEAKSFRQAAELITIPDDIIDGPMKWLSEKQWREKR